MFTEPEAHCLGRPGRPVSSENCLHSPVVGEDASMGSCALIFIWVLEIETQVSMLLHSSQPSHLLSSGF